MQNSEAKIQQNAKNKKSSPNPNIPTALLKYFVTTNDNIQTKVEVRAVAIVFTLSGNNSASMAHGSGPKPILKNRIKVARVMIGTKDNPSRL